MQAFSSANHRSQVNEPIICFLYNNYDKKIFIFQVMMYCFVTLVEQRVTHITLKRNIMLTHLIGKPGKWKKLINVIKYFYIQEQDYTLQFIIKKLFQEGEV